MSDYWPAFVIALAVAVGEGYAFVTFLLGWWSP